MNILIGWLSGKTNWGLTFFTVIILLNVLSWMIIRGSSSRLYSRSARPPIASTSIGVPAPKYQNENSKPEVDNTQNTAGAWIAETFQPTQYAQPVQSAQSVQAAAPLIRYTDLRCPGQVGLSGEFQVTVRLTLRPHAESRDAQRLSALPGTPVVVEIDAPDFDLTEGSTRSIALPDDRDSDWAVFGLKPRAGGPGKVRLRFFQGGHLLGQAQCDVQVVAQPVTSQSQPQPALPLAFGVNDTPPKRILCIALGPKHVDFSLYVDGVRADLSPTTAPLRTNPAAYMRRCYSRLSQLAKQTAGGVFDPAAAEEVKELGNLLWTDLIPPALKYIWLDERAAWAKEPLLVVSDEPYIPWELAWSNEAESDLPWGVHGPMSRWLGVDEMHPARSGPGVQLTLSPWAALLPGDSGVSFLDKEAALLRRLLPGDGERTPAAPDQRAVVDLLAGGECRWLYAGTHGLPDPGGEGEGAALLLAGGETLKPQALVRTAVLAGLRKSRPGVFWNICHGGAGGWSLTGVGGWAGRLIDGGASLFLSPQWTVTDRAALAFSETFYSHLTRGDGQGVAVAAQQARLAARDETGDPSWLAYALYAHPNARVEGPG